MDGMHRRLVKALETKNIFDRERKEMETRALGIVLYHMGLSLRQCEEVLSSREQVSHEAIRQWYHRAAGLFSLEACERDALAIDETKVRIDGEWRIVWAAIDVERWDILAVWITKARSSLEAYSFIKHALRKCTNEPTVYVDKGPWYKPALERLGIPWEHETFGPRNPIEQWFGILKHRIKRFYVRWPHNAGRDTAQQWIAAFVTLYNLRRCLT